VSVALQPEQGIVAGDTIAGLTLHGAGNRLVVGRTPFGRGNCVNLQVASMML
jgi:hypothetical protein